MTHTNHKNFHICTAVLMLCILLAACSDSLFDGDGGKLNGEDRIQLSGSIEQLALTRVCDNGFCDGDVMGVYVVDYNGGTPGTLKPSGNRCDNVRHTFDEANNQWKPANDIYWKDKHTHIDVYGYYPFANPESIDDYQFEVQKDQSRASADGEMGGYEASDFLWGKVGDVAPTTSIIRLPLFHRMSNARVTLIQGSGFADGEWANTEKIVLAPNLVRKASIDLATGEVKPSGSVESTATIPSRVDDEWRAIVVPQTVSAGTTLFSITIGGMPYKFVKNEALTFDGNKWEAGRTLYWDEGTYNAYAYYPYMQDVTSVTDQPFSVSTDQSTQKTATALGGYEASDLLFATTKDVKASDSPVRLTFKHIMSKLKIRLIKGEDFEGDMPTTAKVYIHNTVPTATIDLQAGVATRYVKGTRQTIVAHQDGDTSYSAIIVPQRIDNRQPLVEVEMMGVSYLFESKFLFKPGTEHLVNLVISENPDKVKINIGGEKQNW